MHRANFFSSCFAAAALAFLPQWSAAQAKTEQRMHSIRPGDTFYGLAKDYLKDPALWPSIANANPTLAARRLPLGKTVRIPSATGPALTALVLHVSGPVEVTHKGKAPKALAKQAIVTDGDTLRVPHGCHAVLQLDDRSVIHVHEDTVLTLEQLRHAGARSAQQPALSVYLAQGRVDSVVGPRRTGSRYQVRTPLAVAGVRGTEFGVSFSAQRKSMAVDVIRGSVAVKATATNGADLLTAQHGAHIGAGRGPLAMHSLLPAPGLPHVQTAFADNPTVIAFDRVPKAVAYQVVLARDETLQDVMRTQTLAEPPLRMMALEAGDYYLSVRAVDQNDLRGVPARTRVAVRALPEPPFLRSPQRAEKIRALPPLALRCTEVLTAAAYRFQLSREADFRSVLLDERSAARCAFDTHQQLAPGAYYWRVASIAQRADGGDMVGTFGEGIPFEIVPAPMARDPFVSTIPGGVSLRWAGAADLSYQLQLSRSALFESISRDLRLSEPHVELTALESGEYFVRLKVIDANGFESAFSTPKHFRLNTYLHSSDNQPIRDASGAGVQVP